MPWIKLDIAVRKEHCPAPLPECLCGPHLQLHEMVALAHMQMLAG